MAMGMTDKEPAPPPAQKVVLMPETGKGRLKRIGGSDFESFNNALLNKALNTAWVHEGQTEQAKDDQLQAGIAAMMGFKPTDEIEGMIAAQALAMHNASMESSRKAMIHNQPFEIAQGLRKSAATASRVFIELITALDRKRGKGGQQKVTVEHVHVHAGGQAIVGTIAPGATTGGGGRAANQTEGEPGGSPARLAHDAAIGAGMPSMWGKEPGREPVPIAGNAERPVPSARRKINRATNG